MPASQLLRNTELEYLTITNTIQNMFLCPNSLIYFDIAIFLINYRKQTRYSSFALMTFFQSLYGIVSKLLNIGHMIADMIRENKWISNIDIFFSICINLNLKARKDCVKLSRTYCLSLYPFNSNLD